MYEIIEFFQQGNYIIFTHLVYGELCLRKWHPASSGFYGFLSAYTRHAGFVVLCVYENLNRYILCKSFSLNNIP
jgi:hypothetical protein